MFKRGNRKLALLMLLVAAVALVTPSIAMYASQQLAAGKQSNSAATIAKTRSAAAKVRGMNLYGKLPLSFERNEGQTDPKVKFMSRGPGYTLFLTPTEAVLALHKTPPMAGNDTRLPSPSLSAKPLAGTAGKAEIEVLSVKLIGSNPHAELVGVDQLPGKSNYFIGNDPKKWHTNVPAYSKVRYRNVYPGIDEVYYGTNQRQLEYNFVLAPGADPNLIRLRFDGGERLALNRDGDVVVTFADGDTVTQHLPAIYQEHNGQRVKVAGRTVLRGKNIVGFTLAAYDRRRPLYVDPDLVYSTYLGGSSNEDVVSLGVIGIASYVGGIAADSAGNAYVTGYTISTDFPTTSGAYQTTDGFAYVTKLQADGSGLIYSTYLGNLDAALGIAVDSSGNAYVTGETTSSTFPTTTGAYQTSNAGAADAFVTELNSTGSGLVYSTYLGGNSLDYGLGIAVDSSGEAYVTGVTESSTFPTAGAYQGSLNSPSNAFVTKLKADGSGLLYSTYLGGSLGPSGSLGANESDGIAIDSSGDAYIAGSTSSVNFPVTAGAFQTVNNAAVNLDPTGFVAKLDPAETGNASLVYATYLGGSLDDYAHAIAVDTAGNAYVTGWANSTNQVCIGVGDDYSCCTGPGAGTCNFPTTPGAFQTAQAPAESGIDPDAFVTKVNANGSGLEYSTYLGGDNTDNGYGIAVDSAGNAYVTGTTHSANNENCLAVTNPWNCCTGAGTGTCVGFPITPGAFQTAHAVDFSVFPENDAFVTKLNATGSGLIYSTYLGGGGLDVGTGIAVDSSGLVYATGATSSTNNLCSRFGGCCTGPGTGTCNFPTTTGAFQTDLAGRSNASDAFVTKLDLPAGPTPTATPTATATATPTATVSATATATATSTTSATATPTATATSTATASTSSTPTATSTPTETATRIGATPTATATSGSTATPTTTATPTATPTATATPISEKLTISPHSLAFGKRVAVGKTSKAKTVTIKNAGKKKKGLPVNIEMETASPSIFALKSQCEKTLKPGQSCKVSVTFTPADTTLQIGSLMIYDNVTGSPQTVGLSGMGKTPK